MTVYENRSSLINIPTEAEDAEIVTAALADSDAQPFTDEQLACLLPLRTLRERRRHPTKMCKTKSYSRNDSCLHK